MPDYSNVTIHEDGSVTGTRSLGGRPVPFRGSLPMLWISEAYESSDAAADEIWALQDGYGEPGYVPEQGYDWSGIRDSSPESVAGMFAAAQSLLPLERLAALLDVPEDRVRSAVARLA